MNLSEFAFRIIFLFIPGLIAFNIVSNLTFHKEYKTADILLGSLTYGFICYLIYFFIFIFISSELGFSNQPTFYFAENLENIKTQLDFKEITITTLLAIPIGVVFSAFVNSKWLYKFANKINISNKLDDLGVWNRAFDSELNHWIVIRDEQADTMYQGWVDSFSDGSDEKEILLRDVKVFRESNAELLYLVPGLYISFNNKENIKIEFRSWPFTDNISMDSVNEQLSN
ncbi:MAG: DUF6338 family protein [Xenococcus sp. MO_188.B8]|nr:DUF6338 family protein [Xenococcus sp. MO_188.B8]